MDISYKDDVTELFLLLGASFMAAVNNQLTDGARGGGGYCWELTVKSVDKNDISILLYTYQDALLKLEEEAGRPGERDEAVA